MDDTSTPASLQIAVKLPARYGKIDDERNGSFLFARINAFASRACRAKSVDAIALGAPVQFGSELTDSEYHSAHLVGYLFRYDRPFLDFFD